MYSMTTFEWKGGLKNIVIPAFATEDGEPNLVIKSLTVSIENDRWGFMTVEFAFEDDATSFHGPLHSQNRVSAFVHEVVNTLRFGGYSASGYKYNLSLSPISGEPLTETMMKKYLLLLKLCGIYTFAPPRIVTETFTGRYRGDPQEKSVPYSKYLMEKCLRDLIVEV